MPKKIKIVTTIFTMITALFMLGCAVWAIFALQWLLFFTSLLLLAVFGYFLYLDYFYFFVDKETEEAVGLESDESAK